MILEMQAYEKNSSVGVEVCVRNWEYKMICEL